MWDIVGKAVAKPVYELLGGRVRERLRAYSYLYAEPGDATDVYTDPDLAAARAAEYAELGFTAIKFDPAGPYASFDPRQPALADLDRCERYVGQVREAVGTAATSSSGRTGSSPPRARSAWRGGSSGSSRSGSRSRRRPRRPRRWRAWRARRPSRSRPASG